MPGGHSVQAAVGRWDERTTLVSAQHSVQRLGTCAPHTEAPGVKGAPLTQENLLWAGGDTWALFLPQNS